MKKTMEIKWETEELPDVDRAVVVCTNWSVWVTRMLERPFLDENATDEERYYFCDDYDHEFNIHEINGWFYLPKVILRGYPEWKAKGE